MQFLSHELRRVCFVALKRTEREKERRVLERNSVFFVSKAVVAKLPGAGFTMEYSNSKYDGEFGSDGKFEDEAGTYEYPDGT